MPNVAPLLDRMLGAPFLAVLRAAGELASAHAPSPCEVYLVGGPVRDIYLGRRPVDLDLCVVGDGEQFAHALADAVGGKVGRRSEFGTASVNAPSGPVDVVTARYETYSEPGALPHVTAAGIREDLGRRDYTVNAMAVAVWPSKWGELVDPHGGVSDTLRRQLRVLHDRSFQDDPTRILRGLRYEARLGFKFAHQTQIMIGRDKHLLGRLSPARIRAEFEKILLEPRRAQVLRSAAAQSVLGSVHPSLRVDDAVLQVLESQAPSVGGALWGLAVVTASLTDAEAGVLVARLDPPNDWRQTILAGPRFRAIASLFDQKQLSASELVSLLEPFPVPVLQAQRDLAPSALQRERLEEYLTRLRHVHPDSTGDDLLRAGVPEGPTVGALLAEIRTARLDGRVSSKDEELALAMRRLPMLLRRRG